MPNRHTTLTSLFTDIAGAIRSKTGDSAEIKADDFDTAIEAIPSGGGGGGEFTIKQLLRVDPISSISYDGKFLPEYSLSNWTINSLSFPNLTTIKGNALECANTHSDLNILFSKLEWIDMFGLSNFNEKITLTSDYNVVFPKLTHIGNSSIQYFGSTTNYNRYKYSNYNEPKYNLIIPLLTSSPQSPAYYLNKVRNISARNWMGATNICYSGNSVGTIDIKGWTKAPTGTYNSGLVFGGLNLRKLIIRNSTMCPASKNIEYMWGSGYNKAYFMTGTVNSAYNPNGEHGVIYVPDNLVDTYKNDANWQACFDVNYIKN